MPNESQISTRDVPDLETFTHEHKSRSILKRHSKQLPRIDETTARRCMALRTVVIVNKIDADQERESESQTRTDSAALLDALKQLATLFYSD